MTALVPPSTRGPWQWLYGSGHRWRRRWYRRRAARLPRPVISVGNLMWGGSGKTPITAALATHLRDRGLGVAILSRGYGRKDHAVRIVSRGEGPLLGPRLAGDEPVLLAGMVPGVSVIVAPQRYVAGIHAMERLDAPPDIFVLDDGFSHLELDRDLDLLTFPRADPFAGGRLPPSGRLREPLVSAAHADAVLLTGAESSTAGSELAAALRTFGFSGPGFASTTRIGTPRFLTGEALSPPARVVALAAIARPETFFETVAELGFDIAETLAFSDHHDYPETTLSAIRGACRRHLTDLVVTTAKDRVKLQGRLEEKIVEIPIEARPEAAFFEWFDDHLTAVLAAKEKDASE